MSKGILYDELHDICKYGDYFKYCCRNGLMKDISGEPCPKCADGKVRLAKDSSLTDGKIFRCSKKQCYFKQSIRQNSWFSKSKLSLIIILKLTYFWIYKLPSTYVKRELQLGSDHTLVDWKNFCREVCVEILEKNSEKIGGEGKIVEIDESKFGKRKFHRGRRVDGVWVFGGIERGSNRMFMKIVDSRSSQTLLPSSMNIFYPVH